MNSEKLISPLYLRMQRGIYNMIKFKSTQHWTPYFLSVSFPVVIFMPILYPERISINLPK
jgi:hypothetical protein